MTLHDLERFGGPHHQALEVLCVKALERGEIEAAYRLSDRRCRIRPLAEAHCFVLRAEALHRMGERAAALADSHVQKFVGSATVRKVIVVPGKLVNVVV